MSPTRDEATPAEPLRPRLAARLAALAVPILFAVLAFQPLRGPSPRGANAPSAEFSAARAMVHVRALALAPRVPGTEHHRRSRRYLMERLRALGVEPELQTGRLVRADDRGRVRILTPVNVLARLEGSGRGDEAVLLVAHYDSVAQSPGAGDNAAAVAALLETLRALRTGPPPERDVIVLFSDIEEEGLAGATVFAQEHPWSEEVALVLNFEARGSAGPSLLFETGAGTASTLDGLGDDAPHLFGSSYSDDVYRALPYGTDFTVFRQRGLPGFNFAFIGGRST